MAAQPRRVVVTGLGLVTPLATGVARSWERLLRADSAVARCTRLPEDKLARLPCQIAAEVSYGSAEGEFDVERVVPPELRRHTSAFVHYALAAGAEALADAGWSSEGAGGEGRSERAGVCVGTGMVDLGRVSEASARLEQSYRKLSPFFIPSILGNMPAGHLSIQCVPCPLLQIPLLQIPRLYAGSRVSLPYGSSPPPQPDAVVRGLLLQTPAARP